MRIATVAIVTAVLLSVAAASNQQYQYTFDVATWPEAYPSVAAASAAVAVPGARSDIECVSACEAAAAAGSVCVGVAWCGQAGGGCRLLTDTGAAAAAAPPDGCRSFALSNKLRISGSWCPWQLWSAWTAACHAGSRQRSRHCRCPAPQSAAAGCDRSVDGGDSQADGRYLGWSGWRPWAGWAPAGCPKAQERQRDRVCDDAAAAPVASPSDSSVQTLSQFTTWCDWQSWTSWGTAAIVGMDLRQLDPELRKYLRVTRLPEVYEALLAGLAIMQPANPCKWIAEKLFYLQEVGINQIDWDSFIDEEMKPRESPFAIKGVSGLFSGDMGQDLDEENVPDDDEPSPEMIARAYQHYNRKSFRRYFDSWLQLHLYKRQQKADKRRLVAKADRHFFQSKVGQVFASWLEWTRFRKGRQAMAFEILQRVLHVSVVRVMFKAWHGVSLEARKTREYFERELRRLERGDNVSEDDALSKATGEARDDLSLVPELLRQQILRHLSLADLSRAACVCRAWKVHTQSSELLHKLDFSQVRQRLTPAVAKKFLAQSGPMLSHLSLAGCQALTPDVFQCVAGCRNLQDLNLSECAGLTDDAVGLIVQGCPLLIYLNLSFTGVSDNSLRLVAKHAETLQFLSLAGCQLLSDRGLQYLAQGNGAHRLELIDLSDGVQFSGEAIVQLASKCCKMKQWMFNDVYNLQSSCLEQVATHCPAVEHYELFGCSSLTDESFRAVSNRSLRVMKLDRNDLITDAAFGHLGRRCPDLQLLYMADCVRITDQAVKGIGQLRHLRVLNLADCVRISDAGAKCIAEAAFAQALRELNLTNAVRLTDHGVSAVCKKANNLTHLRLSFCENLTHLAADALAYCPNLVCLDMSGTGINDSAMTMMGNLSKLRYLYLANCPQVTDLGVQKLVQQLNNLEHLDLSHCVQLTDGGVRSLSFSCRLLTRLSLRGCRQITDLSMQYVSGVCHYLAHLDLSECVMITDKSLKYLKKACKRLQHLQINCCQGISKASVIRMTRRIPNVNHSMQDPLGP